MRYGTGTPEDDAMIRGTIRMLAAALVTAFALGSVAEAAPPKTIRHRAKHSRASSYRASRAAKPGQKSKAASRKAKRKPTGTAAKRSTAAKPSTTHSKSPTKPR
jgi:hypothetical protein